MTYSEDFARNRADHRYSPEENGKYSSLTLFKNGDSSTNADWLLETDLLLIQICKSYVNGIFIETKKELPHALTMSEAVKIQQFFLMIIALGLNTSFPQLN